MRVATFRAEAAWALLGLLSQGSSSFLSRRQAVPSIPRVTPAPRLDISALVQRQAEDITAVSDCHAHGGEVWCMAGTTEYEVVVAATATSELPASYTDCHAHASSLYCVDAAGDDVQVLIDDAAAHSGEPEHGGGSDHDGEAGTNSPQESSESTGGMDCHFHAGVEHCVGAEGEHGSSAATCTRQSRDYNIPLRIGLLFVILVTSFIGVAGPIFLKPVLPAKFNVVFVILKQFGTGIIISTAFVHLYTHANLMFTNQCLSGIDYEATTSAIVMAGIFLSFIVDFVSHKIASGSKSHQHGANLHNTDSVVQVLVLEMGIIFHSILIGVTLVVTGDSFFITLFIIILFHQMFEGIALGTRIASINQVAHSAMADTPSSRSTSNDKDSEPAGTSNASSPDSVDEKASKPLPMIQKLFMAVAFAIITPIGMAIGIGALRYFNGNDPSTLIALGTLDALSAGILVWVGLVEMWAADWIFGGEMVRASAMITIAGGVSLVAGMALMSFLGKWA
ncbi:uncharacterized protein JN550_008615 [Neoarthrinium moseri]|uniref:uncharacterized protein n=1 Tax=Neoarthrinium moseri TaxID=1658444 RepID=UPI001FDD0E88|nr:uncharacterized protein JN550_008615 [Neoarthrinium moseri]KAI1865069.1 hypothetical protein JN550_008615 [Neoarthrinium moseri]